MKSFMTFAVLVSTATALAVRNNGFSCPEKTWGGCCAEIDSNEAGHTCHDAATLSAPNQYSCSEYGQLNTCCHFAPWLVHAAHPLICVDPSVAA